MKVKLKLDGDSIKQGFLSHFEKILFGCVVLCFLVFVYRAIGRDRLAFTPEDMRAQATKAQANVDDAKPDPPDAKQYLPAVQPSTIAVNESRYLLSTVLKPQIFQHAKPRNVPGLFPVEKLRGSAGNGAFAMADMSAAESYGGGAGLKGQRWVVLVGLVPWKRQLDAYKEAYEDTLPREMALQYPQYYYFRIDRAQVDPLDDSTELKWEPIHVRRAMQTMELWRGGGGSIDVDPRCQCEPSGSAYLTYPLGPLQNRSWGSEVAYPPEIPLALLSYGEPAAEGAKDAEKDAKKGDAKSADGKDRAPVAKRTPPRSVRPDEPDEPDTMSSGAGGMPGMPGMGSGGMMGPGGMTGYPGMGSGGMMGPGGMTGYPGMGSGGMMGPGGKTGYPGMGSSGMMGPGGKTGYPGMGSGGMMGPGGKTGYPGMGSGGMMGPGGKTGYPGMGSGGMMGPGGMTGSGDGMIEEPQYKLFRFFDFTVEPGKHYRYRVQLQLVNPNLGVAPQYLVSEALGKSRSIQTRWSESSPMISVPRDAQALAVSVKPSDGSATVLLVNVDPQDGATSGEEISVQRGQLLDFRDKDFKGVQPGAMGPMGPMAAMGSMGGMMAPGMVGGSPEADPSAKKINYLTEMVYLDSTGGQRLIGRQGQDLEPAQLLLLGPDGRLLVRNEIDDVPEVAVHKPPEGGEPSGSGAMGGYSGMMGPMGSSSGYPGMTKSGAKGAKTSDPGMMMKMMDDFGTGKKKKR